MRVHRDGATLDLLSAAATVARPSIPRRQQAVRARSAAAHDAELPTMARRAGLIVAWLKRNGAATDRQVMRGLGFTDMNAVRPRISELLDARLLVECGERRCGETGQMVRVVKFNGDAL